MALSDKQWSVLARDVQRAFARAAPQWTDFDASDPGIAVLALLSYAIEDLQPRAADERVRAVARRIAARANALSTGAASAAADASMDDCGPGLLRVRHFSGQILGVDDLRAEQDYARQRLDRRNRLLHGAGIVDGLEVTLGTDDAGGPRITIAPGLAFDPLGREICLEGTATVGLPPDAKVLLLSLSTRSVRAAACRRRRILPRRRLQPDPAATPCMEPTRIVESYAVALAPTSIEDAVAIARLRRVRGRWHVDATFKAARVTA